MARFKLTTNKDTKNKYPYYGLYRTDTLEQLVFFTEPNTGTLIYSSINMDKDVGFMTGWAEKLYEPVTSFTITQEG